LVESGVGESQRGSTQEEAVTTHYEVWDGGTGKRVGGVFESEAQAEELMLDILRTNGLEVASEMAILAFQPAPGGRLEPVVVLEGREFVARHMSTA
jgi:hypothetical protein